jgi:hypothetical protein
MHPNLTDYTKQLVESRLASQYELWFNSNGNQTEAALKIFEKYYLKNGTADDDHLAWLQFAVDVSRH